MSKLKVPLRNAFKMYLITQQIHCKKLLNIFALLKSFKHLNFFIKKPDEDKILTYWVQRSMPEILSMADKFFYEGKYLEVYELLNRIRFTEEVQVLWRISRALYYLSLDEKTTDGIKKEMMTEANDVLNIALKIGDDCAEVHKWSAIVVNKNTGLVNLQNRVKNFGRIRDHLKKACELNPKDFVSHYMLGKWCFEMSHMNWLQRTIAKYIIATEPPTATYEDAYSYLSRAEELQPRKYIPNLYHLGMTCLETGKYYKGKYYLNLVTSLPPRQSCEKCYVASAKHFVKKLDKFDLSKRVLFYGDTYDPFGFND